MGEDIHTVGLVVEYLARLFVWFHITRAVRYELAEGYLAVFVKSVATFFGTFSCRHVHHLRIIIDHLGIGRGQLAFVYGDAEDAGIVGFCRRCLALMALRIDAIIPFGDEITRATDGKVIGFVVDCHCAQSRIDRC